MSISYYSTNHVSPNVSFETALLNGQAPDKGLYLPDHIPQLDSALLKSFKTLPYHEIAFHVLQAFLKDVVPEAELKALTQDAYNFDVPLEQAFDRNYIMRLDQGPTASFKDFAARMMARLMQYFLKQKNEKMLILVATSGDTGSAIANAYFGLDNIQVLVLFPKGEVSDRQRKQMTTLNGNIRVLAIDGKFDDCQAMVKQAFSDVELIDLKLNSANSINFGRLLPQIVYYFYAWSRLAEDGEPITFTVPSGNFGNMMGAVLGARMGLPVEKLVIATNENDEFPAFLASAKYQKVEPSKDCLSNAMNVGHPSNLARLVDLFGGHLDEVGNLTKVPDMAALSRFIFTDRVSDSETKATIKSVYDKYKVVLEPHGAVGWTVFERYLQQNQNTPGLHVVVETAHPAKFPNAIQEQIGLEPALPAALIGIDEKDESFNALDADYSAFKAYLITSYVESMTSRA